ncbi:MAG: polysaccharide biosynthesis/export family protein [bacterium]
MNTFIRAALPAALASVLMVAGCMPSRTASAARYRTVRLEKYRKPIDTETLQPGDRIQILLHTPDLQTVPATLDERGCVTVPIVGSVKIGGLTSARAEEAIKEEYVRKEIYKASAIQIGIQASDRICYVEGHVKRPGPCQFSRPITVNMAISMAGGRDEFADDNAVWLTRGRGGKKQELNGSKDGNIVIVEPGDIIEVPRGIW